MNHDTEQMRLSKRMAQLGFCSRREADVYIEKGWVKVNGQTAVIGLKVTANDRIELSANVHLAQNQKWTILINKPISYVSTQAEKGYQPAEVLVTTENYWTEDNTPMPQLPLMHLAAAGRLDIESTGLLVLTQDGRIAKQLIGENSNTEKEYLVRVTGKIINHGLELLNHGLKLDGEALLPAKVTWQNQDQLRFILRQGKKRQIRRMCEQVGLRVTGLKRVRIGRVRLGALPIGKWRILRPNERF